MIFKKKFEFTKVIRDYNLTDESIKRQLCIDIIRDIPINELEKIFAFKKVAIPKEDSIEASIITPD